MGQMVAARLHYLLTIFSFSIFLLGCTTVAVELPVSTSEILYEPLEEIAPPVRKVPVAVYAFTDKTGQRKPSQNMALISTAVTQGAEIWLIQALIKKFTEFDKDFNNCYIEELTAFITSFTEEKKSVIPLEDGIDTMELILAAEKSEDSRKEELV